ncbi:NUDIX hydrolase [Adhaeribacter radiodurans]|uniref:NUDIX hydrolase n=1 Tax=Adhaeribacter radiodurans TaxID=2745197 RepID=A0A7L7LB12_9BACT|nr:NUDIX domain-containing protein [Adhaeribacter radiodurans]QMU29943.1 NUDIX hydrolase [Adhaeribacter radiodurans]
MSTDSDFLDFIHKGYEQHLPHLSIDCAVFGFHENQLRLLLTKVIRINQWSLPGGFIRREESVDMAAQRILRERTGLDNIYLEQFKVFGSADRNNTPDTKKIVKSVDNNITDDNWLLQRMVSMGYYALVDIAKVTPTPDTLSEECRWWDLTTLPPLLFDHSEIVKDALKALRQHLANKPIGFNLLPEKFTMTELRRLYETILGRTIDRGNFEKKILKLGILDRLDEVKSNVTYKAPFLYKFNTVKYQELLETDAGFGF